MNNQINKVFILAEVSANHGCNLDIALETVRAAKRNSNVI
jgi:sialic acid synthase SpsE